MLTVQKYLHAFPFFPGSLLARQKCKDKLIRFDGYESLFLVLVISVSLEKIRSLYPAALIILQSEL